MAKEIIMPALGMSQETGQIVTWLKSEGDAVQKGEPLMEIETDKTTVEIEAPASGTLGGVTAQAGDEVPVGQVVAYILAAGESVPDPSSSNTAASLPSTIQQAAPRVPKPAALVPEPRRDGGTSEPFKSVTPVAQRMAATHNIDLAQVPSRGNRITRADVEAFLNDDGATHPAPGIVLASPKARRLAREKQLDLATIAGSGPEGAVLAADVLAHDPVIAQAEMVVPPEQATSSSPSGLQTGTMWRRMAERLSQSWQSVPHFYLKREVDVRQMIAWREQLKQRSPVKITYTDLLVKLVAAALQQHPFANGYWNGEGVVFNEDVNVGLAVAVDQGLLVPVIHRANTLGLQAIATRRAEIVQRSMDGKLQPADLQGGTFTISNLGMFGIDEFEAIVNPPQAAILAVGRIIEKVLPINGTVETVPTMALRLSCDHRAIDGARGAQFLDTLAKRIEAPLSLLE